MGLSSQIWRPYVSALDVNNCQKLWALRHLHCYLHVLVSWQHSHWRSVHNMIIWLAGDCPIVAGPGQSAPFACFAPRHQAREHLLDSRPQAQARGHGLGHPEFNGAGFHALRNARLHGARGMSHPHPHSGAPAPTRLMVCNAMCPEMP